MMKVKLDDKFTLLVDIDFNGEIDGNNLVYTTKMIEKIQKIFNDCNQPDYSKSECSPKISTRGRYSKGELWTEEDIALLLDLKDNKQIPFAEIIKGYFPNRTYQSVYNKYNFVKVHKNKPMKSSKIWTEDKKKLLIEARNSGMTFPEISKKYFPDKNSNLLQLTYHRFAGDVRSNVRGRPKGSLGKQNKSWTMNKIKVLIEARDIEGLSFKGIKKKYFPDKTIKSLYKIYGKNKNK